MDHQDGSRGWTRRDFHRFGALALAAAGVPLLARVGRAAHHEAGEGDAKLVDEIAANEALVSAIQYVNESTKEGQQCSGCALFTAGEGGRGKCSLFQQGVVSANGWCTSWVAKPA